MAYTFKLNYSDGESKVISMPTEWREVTWHTYCKLLKATADVKGEELIKQTIIVLTGMSEDDYEQLPSSLWLQLSSLISFTKELPQQQVPEEYKDFDVGNVAWKHLLMFDTAVNHVMDKYKGLDDDEAEPMRSVELFCLGDIAAKEFIGIDISNHPITDVAWCGSFFLRKYISFVLISASLQQEKASQNTQSWSGLASIHC